MKTNKYVLFFFLLLLNTSLFAQREANNWQFGVGAGINFNTSPPTSINSNISTMEGCASVSDGSGNLLFYTDGVYVFDKNNNLMTFSTGLLGDESSTQSAVIVRKPGSSSIYYIFTVAVIGSSNGLQYSTVDMSINGTAGPNQPTGIVTSFNTPLTGNKQIYEKVAVYKKSDCSGYWVVAHEAGSNTFLEYEVTSAGVNSTATTYSVGLVGSNNGTLACLNTAGEVNSYGYLKFSPDGRALAMALYCDNTVELYFFNPSTGVISIWCTLHDDTHLKSVYGVEFSPGFDITKPPMSQGNYLYTTSTGPTTTAPTIYLSQLDLSLPTAATIISNRLTISSYDPALVAYNGFGALQLGPDNRIYVARGGMNFLSCILSPNIPGVGCDYREDYITLGNNTCYMGLPDLVTNVAACPVSEADNCCKDFNKKVVSSITTSNTFNIHVRFSAGPKLIKRVVAEILDIRTTYNDQTTEGNGATNCATCDNNSDNWGNFYVTDANAISIFSLPGKLTVPGSSPSQYGREIVWGSMYGPGQNMSSFSPYIDIKLGLPLKKPSSCCVDTVKMCVRYKFTDIDCRTCDTVVCYKIVNTGKKIGMIDNNGDNNLTEMQDVNQFSVGQSAGIVNIDIPAASKLKVTIYDAKGNELMKVYDDLMNKGQYAFDLNAYNLPDGVYYYKSEYSDKTEYNKILVAKPVTGCNCGH